MPGKTVAAVNQDTPNPSVSRAGLRERAKRTLGDLVVAEVFFVQATIESATALGDGITALREHLGASNDNDAPEEALGELIKRTRESVVEPYAVRFSSLREVMRKRAA